jgi:hypothetical protein
MRLPERMDIWLIIHPLKTQGDYASLFQWSHSGGRCTAARFDAAALRQEPISRKTTSYPVIVSPS